MSLVLEGLDVLDLFTQNYKFTFGWHILRA